MKRIFKYTILLFGLAAVSCNVNNHPTFDDGDAFVAFDKTSMTVKESAEVISIPVTLASVSGIATTVSYEYVAEPDSTVIPKAKRALPGTNFELADPTGTLTFSAAERTQYIKVKIFDNPGVFTGDLKFQLRIKNSGDVKTSSENNVVVTISDNDHPLSSILGTYSCTGDSYWAGGTVTWNMTFEKDPEDLTVIWITGIGSPYVETLDGFYGVVKMDGTTPISIAIPLGQVNALNKTSYGDGNIYLTGFDGDEEHELVDSGNITVTISDNGKTITFDSKLGPAVDLGGSGYYDEIMFPGITGTKTE